MTPFWTTTAGPKLAQGDWLPNCLLPVFPADLEYGENAPAISTPIDRTDLIVVTQSCDLENEKVSFVALCPIHSLDAFEAVNPECKKKSFWETVRKGRVEALHLLASPTTPVNNRAALVVDFGHIISLPLAYAAQHAMEPGERWRLQSPYLEHFSQAFARFFMRVGLPSAIPPYK